MLRRRICESLLFTNIDSYSVSCRTSPRQIGSLITDFAIDWVRRFRAPWKYKNIAARKKLEAFRAFFRFVHESSWIHTNPAVQLKPPRITAPPTVPFARGEVAEILKACENIQIRQIGFGYARLCSFLATAGCASVTLRRLAATEFRHDKLFLYIAKTGTPVFCPLPPFVIEVLNAIPENTFFGPDCQRPERQRGSGRKV
jgi:integrase/recombinase XerD